MSIEAWATHRGVMASLISLIVGGAYGDALQTSISDFAKTHKVQRLLWTVAQCDKIFVKVWQQALSSAFKIRDEADCTGESSTAEVSCSAQRHLES